MFISHFLGTSWEYFICVVVTSWVNFRQNVYLNINYSFMTTMNEMDFRINTVFTSNGADKVTYHQNYFKQKQ